MWQYIIKRVLLLIPTLVGAAILVFFIMNNSSCLLRDS